MSQVDNYGALLVTPRDASGNAGPPASEIHLGSLTGLAVVVAAPQFTRPADTAIYASGDLVANNLAFGSVVALTFAVARIAGASVLVRRARIKKSSVGVTNAQFRLHLYGVVPTVANGDNGVWSSTQAATYLGALDVTVDKAFSDGAAGHGAPVVGSELTIVPAVSTIYGLLEARAAYTPVSAETIDVSLEVFQN